MSIVSSRLWSDGLAIRNPWLWETEEGRRWLHRLMVATLYTFGFKRGVGVETLTSFLTGLRLETQVGCSPSALRGVMEALAVTIAETVQVWEQDGVAAGEVREIIGAVDETFFERMILVFMDLATDYLVLEEVADRSDLCDVEGVGRCTAQSPRHRGAVPGQ